MRLVVATANPGKTREFGRLLGSRFSVEPLPSGVVLPEETGVTFAENARLKAYGAFDALGGAVAVLADDSGIEVAALGGLPGVRSARFAGEDASDEANVALLLERLGACTDREARFVCALALVLPGPPSSGGLREAQGLLPGSVTHHPRGLDGFGYDPVFVPNGWDITLAEAGPESKDQISHRGRAVSTLLEALRQEGAFADG
ncbi:MAG: non-canonical purine NTP pyrophosphatase [Actinobacteria bacterium]|nr:non-canonical purine NTP pyrophosphatase [Actinomycetota bacterium]